MESASRTNGGPSSPARANAPARPARPRGSLVLSALPLDDGPTDQEPLGHALAALDGDLELRDKVCHFINRQEAVLIQIEVFEDFLQQRGVLACKLEDA